MNKIVLLSSFGVILFSVSGLSQLPPPPLRSPEVQPDGHVIFRFRAPNAQKVEVSIEGQTAHIPMQKDEQGIWTLTTGPLQPDFYGYSFLADDVDLIDPSNSVIKPNLLHPANEVHVPGPSLPWELNQVPHGEIHHHFYHSKIADLDSDFYVYTPPDYRANAKQDYPVLYLLHGFSDDASGWTAVGRANVIFDNLIAQGKMKAMIVVNPLGYGDYEVIRRGWGSWGDKDLARHNLSNFTSVLLNEVIPQVEGMYRIKKDRESRAIAGLSMGGAESLLTGLNHLDQFAWIGAFSSGGIDLQDFGTEFPGLDAGANKKLKLLWIACGTEDGLVKVNRQFKSWLKDKGVNFTDIETPGMHTWMVWRRNLSAFAPLLFK
ncbi:MAG TPA: alpha/beta hydrolase-fold protein [Terriglobales bacterium]|nr:alpha/beta hydrolase-fold protein [Terriglobales bacterium]